MPKYFVQNRYLLLFFFFSMLYSWKLALSFNFITYDDVSTSAQAHNPTIYSFIQVFLNTNKFRREKERLLLNWALAFKNIVWFLYWNEMSREERKKSILMCGFFFCFVSSAYLQSGEPYSTYHSWTYFLCCYSNTIPVTG